MLTNDKMRAGRFEGYAKCRRFYRDIVEYLRADGVVMLSTYAGGKQYDKRHVESFKVDKSGVYVRRGKSWDCIMSDNGYAHVGVRFYRQSA